PSSNGPIQLNTLVFNLATSGSVTVANGGSNSVARLAIGSTTVNGSTCTVAASVVTCTLTSYQIASPQTFTLYVTTGGSLGNAGNSSLTVSFAASSNQSWTDIAGGGSAVTGGTNTTYFDNYPTQTWNFHN